MRLHRDDQRSHTSRLLLWSFEDPSIPEAVAIGPPSLYTYMLSALLPPGKIWRLTGSVLANLLAGCADELGRFDARVTALLAEAIPSTANELLPDYEAELGLVIDPTSASGTIAAQQAQVVSRLIAQQGFRPVDLQNTLAPLLGQTASAVVIIERTPSQVIALGDTREIFRFFVYRDPTLPGSYLLASAQQLLDTIEPSHTEGYVIESVNFLCDDPHSLCDRDLLGA